MACLACGEPNVTCQSCPVVACQGLDNPSVAVILYWPGSKNEWSVKPMGSHTKPAG